MKKTLLILLILILPLQVLSLAERNFKHIVASQHSTALFIKHYAEHVALVMHHHDDVDENDEGTTPHNDESPQSARHIVDFDHGFSINILLATTVYVLTPTPVIRTALVIRSDSFDDRSIPPLRRPPRTLV